MTYHQSLTWVTWFMVSSSDCVAISFVAINPQRLGSSTVCKLGQILALWAQESSEES